MPIFQQLLKGRLLWTVAMACVLSIAATPAQAAPVSYSFTGSLQGDPVGMFPVFGKFKFDNETGGSGGAYNGAVKDFEITVGGYTSRFAFGANAVTISDNSNLGGGVLGDRWGLASAATGNELNGFTPFSFDLRFDRAAGGLFSNTDLQGPPTFSNFATSGLSAARWRLFFEDADGNPAAVLGSISSLTAVPLPAGVVLFGIGLISLVGLGAGGMRNLGGAKVE